MHTHTHTQKALPLVEWLISWCFSRMFLCKYTAHSLQISPWIWVSFPFLCGCFQCHQPEPCLYSQTTSSTQQLLLVLKSPTGTASIWGGMSVTQIRRLFLPSCIKCQGFLTAQGSGHAAFQARSACPSTFTISSVAADLGILCLVLFAQDSVPVRSLHGKGNVTFFQKTYYLKPPI